MRLDDLSTYKKIAFYKLVSRKELEGIADERAGMRLAGGQVRQRREKGRASHVSGERTKLRGPSGGERGEGKRKRAPHVRAK